MKKRNLYQAVKDKCNPDEIELKGPFECRRANAWLGKGYYFGDSFIELAHWWGRESCDGKYVICLSHCDNSFPNTFDLYNSPEHLSIFRNRYKALVNEYPNKEITVAFVLEMLKDHSEFTKEFHAIRAKSEMCWKDSPRVKFIPKNSSYLEMIPPIQICVLNKVFLIDGEYKIVYPDEYLTEGVV